MDILKSERSRSKDPLKMLAIEARNKLFPLSKKVWWEPLPVANYVLESYSINQDSRVISTEVYHHRANGGRYARNPAITNLEYVPTVIIGPESDLNRIARRDGSETYDLNLADGLDLPNIGIKLSPEEIQEIPEIETVLAQERLMGLGRKSSFVLTQILPSKNNTHIFKIYENLLKSGSQESFIHIMKQDESQIGEEVGGIMITNSEEYVQKALSKR